jgi:hypothetical protein
MATTKKQQGQARADGNLLSNSSKKENPYIRTKEPEQVPDLDLDLDQRTTKNKPEKKESRKRRAPKNPQQHYRKPPRPRKRYFKTPLSLSLFFYIFKFPPVFFPFATTKKFPTKFYYFWGVSL